MSREENGGLLKGGEREHYGHEAAAATANVVKLILGSGSFALPWAFAQAGIVGGTMGVLFIAFIATITIRMMVMAKRSVDDEKQGSYADIAGALLGPKWSSTVKVATGLSCFGACAGYMTFIGEIFSDILGISTTKVIAFMLPIFILLSWVRTWRHMAYWSLFGNSSFFLAIAAVALDAWLHWSSMATKPQVEMLKSVRKLPLFWGPTVFLFCIHYVALPIEKEMNHPKNFTLFVIPASFGICAFLNALFGAGCYMAYGSDVADNVMRNIRPGIISHVISICLATDLAVTFALMLAPVREYIESEVFKNVHHAGAVASWAENGLRAGLVVFIACIALAVPHFAILIGLAGGVTDTLQTFVIPPMLFVAALRRDTKSGSSALQLVSAFGIAMLGSVFMLWTVANIMRGASGT